MKQLIRLICIATGLVLPAGARIWTNTAGETFEAEVVWVHEDREVKLSTPDGQIQVLPFSTFSEECEATLDDLLFHQIHGDPHPVSWQTMNELFGMDIWKDVYLLDDRTGPAAERMKLEKESETDFMSNYRIYPLGEENVLSEPVYTAVLYGGKETVTSLSFVFLNQGDIKLPKYMNKDFIEQMIEDIEAAGMRVHDVLEPVLGKPERDTIGKSSMREKVWRWDWNDQAILLSMQEGKYAMLRILPVELADRSGKVEKIDSDELRERMQSCVEKRDNGDVVINNIPMIDQGPKGYCVPATWERYLRYLGIPADMYVLANAGDTGIGGGTYTKDIIDATRSLLFTNGRDLDEIDDLLDIETVSEYIDLGMPIMWSYATAFRPFQAAINRHNAQRNGEEPEEDENNNGGLGGHICLIMGYNAKTDEIAISDSWGPDYTERWLPVYLAEDLLRSVTYVIKW